MLAWIIISAIIVAAFLGFSAFTVVAPQVSRRVFVTDPPENTPPPAISMGRYPLVTRDPNEPITYVYSGSQSTRNMRF